MNEQFAQIHKGKKVFVASDFHLGAPTQVENRAREIKIVAWLSAIEETAAGIILAGDLFDFWFEYKKVVPKGAVRLLGKLASLSDAGIPILIFTGNHDLWMSDYFITELGANVYHHPISFLIGEHRILIGHGDGLGPGDRKFKLIKRIFTSKLNKNLFRWLHPDIGIALANKWSNKSRIKNLKEPDPFLGEDEPLFQYCKAIEKTDHHDYYIFGHRHLHLEMELSDKARYINIGDWINYNTYAEISVDQVKVKTFES
ncbi:MAG: UDP-2,3-diacylglucosamine hydrolase [Cyclobacteriaceae bacterium]|jgi:UDP-2,3-diacylglucosamine hydrolase